MNDQLTKGLVHAGVTTGAGLLLTRQYGYDANFRLNIGNMEVPAWVILAGAGFLNSYIVDMIHDEIKKEVPRKAIIADSSSLVIGAISSGAILSLIMYSAGKDSVQQLGLLKLMLIGAGSEIAADAIIGYM